MTAGVVWRMNFNQGKMVCFGDEGGVLRRMAQSNGAVSFFVFS